MNKRETVVDEFGEVVEANVDNEKQEGEPSLPGTRPADQPEQTGAKQGGKALSPCDHVVARILRRAGVESVPPLSAIMAGKMGPRVKLKDIGIFIGKPKDEVLATLAKACPVKNRANLSAEVSLDQMVKVGVQVVGAGRMFSPITVARIKEDGAIECTSGRHRLALLCLLYGPDIDIPVYVEDLQINEARDAVVVANDSRAIQAREKAQHLILKAVGGDVDVKQDDLYSAVCHSRRSARKYAVYSIFERKHPARIAFAVGSRKDGALTTVAGIELYLASAVIWDKGVERKEFDGQIKAAVEFLNAITAAMQAEKGFDAEQHMASMTMTAIGKFHYHYCLQFGDSMPVAAQAAKALVGLGAVGRQPSNTTHRAIAKAVTKDGGK